MDLSGDEALDSVFPRILDGRTRALTSLTMSKARHSLRSKVLVAIDHVAYVMVPFYAGADSIMAFSIGHPPTHL
jgi:hypothetical protein